MPGPNLCSPAFRHPPALRTEVHFLATTHLTGIDFCGDSRDANVCPVQAFLQKKWFKKSEDGLENQSKLFQPSLPFLQREPQVCISAHAILNDRDVHNTI